MTATGRVCTGFSKPYVALYSATGTTVTYTSKQVLARGVSVSLEVETSDDNIFRADNQAAENASGTFKSGKVTLTVDGLLDATRKLIFGLPAADTDGWTAYGDNMVVPYVGIGYIARYMSDGVECFVPTIITKAKFSIPNQSANTQGEDIEWQTEELSASIMRDDSSNHNWKFVGNEYTTEALAEAALQSKLA